MKMAVFFDAVWAGLDFLDSSCTVTVTDMTCTLLSYLRFEDVSGRAREHGAVHVEVGVGEGLVVHGDHLDAARPHAHGVEVGRVDPHARRVHSHQL